MTTKTALVIGADNTWLDFSVGKIICNDLLDRGFHVYGAGLDASDIAHKNFSQLHLNLYDDDSVTEFLVELRSEVEGLDLIVFCHYQLSEVTSVDGASHSGALLAPEQWKDYFVYNISSTLSLITELENMIELQDGSVTFLYPGIPSGSLGPQVSLYLPTLLDQSLSSALHTLLNGLKRHYLFPVYVKDFSLYDLEYWDESLFAQTIEQFFEFYYKSIN